jgi:hypothetical protein
MKSCNVERGARRIDVSSIHTQSHLSDGITFALDLVGKTIR